MVKRRNSTSKRLTVILAIEDYEAMRTLAFDLKEISNGSEAIRYFATIGFNREVNTIGEKNAKRVF